MKKITRTLALFLVGWGMALPLAAQDPAALNEARRSYDEGNCGAVIEPLETARLQDRL